MSAQKLMSWRTVPLAVMLSFGVARSLIQAQQPPAGEPEPVAASGADQGQVLTSGPVHEAFAQPMQYDATRPLIVAKQPPNPIDEIPPEAKPDGDSVVWIPGYWAWDDDRRDFIWLSGIWREAPPGQVWVSGYWTQAENGYQWVPGFWTSEQQQEVAYLPQPPADPAEAPSTPQPAEDDFWVPGLWTWADNHYVWRAGYWAQMQPDWLWTPAHYVWSPRGYIYIPGYWDRPLIDRGVLFAPTYFASTVYSQPNFAYTPSIALDTGLLTVNLFARPDYCHYYYGDYYAQNYAALGIQPWYSYNVGRHTAYDPLFSYYRTYYRQHDPDWFGRQRERYSYLVNHPEARPARTYQQERRWAERDGGGRFNSFTSYDQNRTSIAAPYRQFIDGQRSFTGERPENSWRPRFTSIDRQQRQAIEHHATSMREFARTRSDFERQSHGADRGNPAAGGQRHALDLHTLTSADARGQRPESRTALRPNTEEPGSRTDGPRPEDRGPANITPREPGRGNATTPEPRINQPRATEPRLNEPRVNEPRVTAPRINEPRLNEPRISEPRGNQPRINEPRNNEPRVNEPRINQPRVTEPRVEPRPGGGRPEPRATEPRVQEPRGAEPRTALRPEVTTPRETPHAAPHAELPHADGRSTPQPELPHAGPTPHAETPHQVTPHTESAPRTRDAAPRNEPQPHGGPHAAPDTHSGPTHAAPTARPAPHPVPAPHQAPAAHPAPAPQAPAAHPAPARGDGKPDGKDDHKKGK